MIKLWIPDRKVRARQFMRDGAIIACLGKGKHNLGKENLSCKKTSGWFLSLRLIDMLYKFKVYNVLI